MPETLGKYHIHSELGKGGFATVYRAVDTTLDREVALKVLDPLLMRDATWAERFRREAKTIAALKHPAIVPIYEINEVEGRLYLAMELAAGGSLADAIAARGSLSWVETLALLKPVCEALDYAHGQGVIHRDLKPANILLTAEGQPLLTDFGFARLLGDNTMSLSLSGGILGTPAYIAPEVWELDTANAPADIYALGCIVYEILTGVPLFGGKTPMQTMRTHDQGPQYPATWPEGIPEGLAAVLNKALARKPGARYASAITFWHALNDLEARAESARQTAQLAAVAAQWRAETEAAIQAGEWSAAKLAVGRWLKVAPEDVQAQQVQTKIAQRMAAMEQPAALQLAMAASTENQQAVPASQETQPQRMIAPPPGASTTQRVPPSPPTTQKKRRVPIWVVILVSLLVISICLCAGISTCSGGLRALTTQPQRVSATTARPVSVTPTGPGSFQIKVVNQSPDEVCCVLISSSDSDEWGGDWLGGEETIASGDSKTFTVPAGPHDIQLEACDEAVMATGWNIENNKTITVGDSRATSRLFFDNASDTEVCYVFISSSTGDDWGDDLMGESETIMVGRTRIFYVRPGTYDLMARDCDDNVLAEEYEIDLSSDKTWTFYNE